MYLLNINNGIKDSYIVASTAIDEAVKKTIDNIKGITFVTTTSKLNSESTNVLVSVKLTFNKSNYSFKKTIEEVEAKVVDQIKLLIGKKPQNVELIVGKNV